MPIMLERQDNGLLLPSDRKPETSNRSGNKQFRHQAERDILRDRGTMNARAIVAALRESDIIVSERTIQRDLADLVRSKEVISKGHGSETEYQLVATTGGVS